MEYKKLHEVDEADLADRAEFLECVDGRGLITSLGRLGRRLADYLGMETTSVEYKAYRDLEKLARQKGANLVVIRKVDNLDSELGEEVLIKADLYRTNK